MKEIKLTGKWANGKVALIDDEDYIKITKYSWYCHKSNKNREYYVAVARINNKLVRMHRYIKESEYAAIDHIDNNPLNNQKYNLRQATHVQNMSNMSSHRGASSKYVGVSVVKRKGVITAWAADCKSGKIRKARKFKTEIEAALQYNEWAIELRGEYAKLNIIDN